MFAIILLPLYIALNYYIAHWLIVYLSTCHRFFTNRITKIIIIAIYVFVSSSLLFGFILPNGYISRLLTLMGNYYLGILLYVFITVVILDIIRLILYKTKIINRGKNKKLFIITGAICIVIILSLSIYGVVNARIIHTTKYEITIPKKVDNMNELNVVMVSDLHMGSNIGCFQINNMVQKINEQNPDLVVIAGDIFNNDYDLLDDPPRLIKILKSIKSKYGVYAVYGNHDVEEKLLAGFNFGHKKSVANEKMNKFLKDANIQILQDELVLIDNSIYLFGRVDYFKLGENITKRKTPSEITKNLDKEKPIIVIDHEPRELEELSKAGVDLDLSGHTHNGQLFPGNIYVKFVWENPYGYLKKNNMHSIVSSGVGLYGPNMRVFTKSEITSIKIKFN